MKSCEVSGKYLGYIDFIIDDQLTDAELWRKCIEIFGTDADNHDHGWRGEYFGKMMRGACLVYRVRPSEKLYKTLEKAASDLLLRQDELGRFSTYDKNAEFLGWDIWARKYVMTGLLHFYEICRSGELKERIISALCRHADYMTEHLGEGKTDILTASDHWGGVNSASILEPFIALYNVTKKPAYLDFARYIIGTGGCTFGNLFDSAEAHKKPADYPENKAYETMSFFEGVLEYYKVTGEEKWLRYVESFAEAVINNEITVVGSSGCSGEQFNNSTFVQAVYTGKIMQETCVTVTLMRFLSKLYLTNGDNRLIKIIRLAAFNALPGALNTEHFMQFSQERKEYRKGLTFDSYSPLIDMQRGIGVGGFKMFADGTNFGCCACIGSAGFGLAPLMSITECADGYRINYLIEGHYEFERGQNTVSFDVTENGISVFCDTPEIFSLYISNGVSSLMITSEIKSKSKKSLDGYTVFSGIWKSGDLVEITRKNEFFSYKKDGRRAFAYGGFVLCADEKNGYKPGESFAFSDEFEVLPQEKDESVRIAVKTAAGALVLTDYASSGKDGKSKLCVFIAEK